MNERLELHIFDMGGSIVAPDKPDVTYLHSFLDFLNSWLEKNPSHSAIIVIGGGAVAREWQKALKELAPFSSSETLDWVGVMATRLNAELMRGLLGTLCPDPVVTNPSESFPFNGRVLVAAGWKPGFSTDYDAVILAERFKVNTITVLSNISQIYDKDPSVSNLAKPISELTWNEYKKLAGSEWHPGANIPFDPVASERASSAGLKIICAAGNDFENLAAILRGGEFTGTVIGP
ncbi:Uridine monophosphate kinase [Olavius algarvensis spirochete endosymbiont]|uniref:UMP kinase n=1 Tax=Olavius algarvensis spirochete endosymbiont TaxID=260710 RepID=UPI000F1AE70D|nr:UMP kinase [Olavius algarvensis spirochete endosymbiont]CAD7841990.1 MAG: hypothetical protein [Olavius algarvensis spirochete endosymbiont]VDB01074.1 Uridine monophosphate kinase [Olavius algarvensis spirochete endosymbiont]